jgi:hypothetical protein
MDHNECNSCRSESGPSIACFLATMAACGLGVGGEIYRLSREPRKQLKGHFLLELAKVADNIAKLACSFRAVPEIKNRAEINSRPYSAGTTLELE